MIRTALIVSSIALLQVPVKAVEVPKTNASTISRKDASQRTDHSLEKFIEQVLREGYEDNLHPGRAKALKLTPDIPMAVMYFSSDICADGNSRSFHVLLATATDHDKPIGLILQRGQVNLKKRTAREILLSLTVEGKARGAYIASGLLDEAARPIPESGKPQRKDPASPEMQKILRYELEFWLEGRHRKPKPQPEPEKRLKPAKKKGK